MNHEPERDPKLTITSDDILSDFERLRNAKGSNAKKVVLPTINEMTRRLMTLSMDSFWNPRDRKPRFTIGRTEDWGEVLSFLEANDMRTFAKQFTIDAMQETILRSLLKGFQDEKLGVGKTTFLKQFPGAFATFDVQLALLYEEDKHWVDGGVWVEPKIDGVRCIILVDDNGFVQVLSRNGKPILNIDPDIISTLSRYPNRMFDGEVVAGSDFNVTAGVIHRKTSLEMLTILLFDTMDLASFKERRCGIKLEDRRSFISARDDLAPLLIERHWAATKEEIYDLYAQFRRRKLEGEIVKLPNSMYEFDRTEVWTKIKGEITVDLPVVGYYEGQGKLRGMLGGLVVEDVRYPPPADHPEWKGARTRVGSGLSDPDRKQLWAIRDELVANAQIIEVEGHEYGKTGAIRHPRFVRVRWDKDEAEGS